MGVQSVCNFYSLNNAQNYNYQTNSYANNICNLFNFGQIGAINISNQAPQQSSMNGIVYLLQALLNNFSKQSTKQTNVDTTTVDVSKKDEKVHGYTALHQKLAWGEDAAAKMWNLYDANKDGVLDHDEDAALRMTFAQGSAGSWTDKSCRNMMNQKGTPDSFKENLNYIKSLSSKEDNVYYNAALSSYSQWIGKPGTV